MIRIAAARLATVAILLGGLAIAACSSRDDAEPTPGVESAAAPAAHFVIRWQGSELTLSGHVASTEHEQALLQSANNAHPDAPLSTDFQTLPSAPSDWQTTSIEALLATSASIAANVQQSTVDDAIALDFRIVVSNESLWRTRLDALRQALAANTVISVDQVLLDKNNTAAELCEQASANFAAGAIGFEESTIEFRTSAYPSLARVLALARSCRETIIRITGHTDSSGSEEWNKQLSHKRAAAVGDYLIENGVRAVRLQTIGAGSSAPIASNATRYGRSFNRRIEIEFRPTPASSDEAAQY